MGVQLFDRCVGLHTLHLDGALSGVDGKALLGAAPNLCALHLNLDDPSETRGPLLVLQAPAAWPDLRELHLHNAGRGTISAVRHTTHKLRRFRHLGLLGAGGNVERLLTDVTSKGSGAFVATLRTVEISTSYTGGSWSRIGYALSANPLDRVTLVRGGDADLEATRCSRAGATVHSEVVGQFVSGYGHLQRLGELCVRGAVTPVTARSIVVIYRPRLLACDLTLRMRTHEERALAYSTAATIKCGLRLADLERIYHVPGKDGERYQEQLRLVGGNPAQTSKSFRAIKCLHKPLGVVIPRAGYNQIQYNPIRTNLASRCGPVAR